MGVYFFFFLQERTTCLLNREGEEHGNHLWKNDWVFFHREHGSNLSIWQHEKPDISLSAGDQITFSIQKWHGRRIADIQSSQIITKLSITKAGNMASELSGDILMLSQLWQMEFLKDKDCFINLFCLLTEKNFNWCSSIGSMPQNWWYCFGVWKERKEEGHYLLLEKLIYFHWLKSDNSVDFPSSCVIW